MLKFLRKIKDYLLLKRSGFFDEEYYCLQYPDVRQADVNPLWHFVSYGWKEGRNPSSDFDSNYCLYTNPDVALVGINPLYHYIKHGRKEGRDTLPPSTKPVLATTTILYSQPLVSVVIATYNGKETITETLQSVLSQTYRNLELIIVDDCSQDDTTQICKYIAPKAKLFSINHSGTMAARAFGAEKASGEFLFFLDQDDILFSECVNKEISMLLENPEYGLACGNMACIGEEDEDLGFNVIPNPSADAYHWDNLLLIYPLAMSTTLVRTKLYFEIGGWDSRFSYSGALGDSDFYVRVAEVSRILFLPEILGKYRWSENRPGRLSSFIKNLAEYVKKYSNHPRLRGVHGAALRQKFIKACVSYGVHIFNLILQQETAISEDLFSEQQLFFVTLKNAFRKDLERVTGITPIVYSYYDLDNAYVRLILYKYQISRGWQALYKSVALGEPGQFLNWLKFKITHDKENDEYRFLPDQSNEILRMRSNDFFPSQKKFNIQVSSNNSDPLIVLFYSGTEKRLLKSISVLRSLDFKFSKILIVGEKVDLLSINETDTLIAKVQEGLFETIKEIQQKEKIVSEITILISDQFILNRDSLNELTRCVKDGNSQKLVFGRILLGQTLESLNPVIPLARNPIIINEISSDCFSDLAYTRESKVARIDFCAFSSKLLNSDFFEKAKNEGNYLVANEKLFVYRPSAIVIDPDGNDDSEEITTSGNLSADWLKSTQELKILFVDDYIPAIQLGSGFPREQEMLLTLKRLGYFVTFYPVGNPLPFEPDTTFLQNAGIEIFHSGIISLIEFLEFRKGLYDIVIISRPHVFSMYVDLIRKYQENAQIIYDAEALFYSREQAKRAALGESQNEIKLSEMEKEELDLLSKADLVISVSEREKEVMQSKKPNLQVGVWAHMQNLKPSSNNFEERNDILFYGSFVAGPGSPNEDALLFFANQVFPALHDELGCKLIVVGSSPTQKILDLSSKEIIVKGFVDNPGVYFNKCRVSVVPTRFAAGIPLKLIETFSFGLPTIVSELIANQLQLQHGFHVLIANDAKDFIEQTVLLYKTKWLWNHLWHNSREYINANFSEQTMTTRLRDIIDTANSRKNLENKI